MPTYRTKGSQTPGPDYKCKNCGINNVRLWRQTHTMLDYVELACSVCATEQQKEQIAQYASFHNKHDCGIGDLVPARPTPEGDTFWGHTSGDVDWWYALPQYNNWELELAQVRMERDNYLSLYHCELQARMRSLGVNV
jgi:hypothetical protein